ncbi:MAG: OmpH family outer membrane protein [Halobacteriovoraceae bacterium]|nr:OmpH family outer membrane protein [Halobacteriovoraceae bacterium]MCB9095481.1 OmpH family outer membrane protein [Halobacteriovoraceae bacterium]
MKVLLVMMTLCFASMNFAKAEVSIGVVNIQDVLDNIKEGKRVTATLKKSYEEKKKKIKSKEDALKKKQQDLSKQASFLSAEARAKKQGELQQEILKLQQLTVEYQREIQQQEATLKKPILEKIKKIVDEVSKAENVDMTVEMSSSPVVYAKSKKDITKQVISKYDKAHK